MPTTKIKYKGKTKVCPLCHKRKSATLANFSPSKGGYICWCKSCVSRKATEWNKAHPKKSEWNHRKHRLKVLYGMSLEDYEARLRSQGGVCVICKNPPDGSGRFGKLHVDHDHSTGAVRDLLCFSCNAGLGNLKDNPTLLRTAANYLDYHQSRKGTTK